MVIDIQSIFTILFVIILSLSLWFNRKKLTIQKILFPVLYLILYKAKWGLNFMNKYSKKFPRTLNFLSVIGIYLGFIGMIFISYELLINIWRIFTVPGAPAGAGLVLPFKAKGAFYVPFFYWIISIFVLATVHEFSHGIIARLHNIRVKSSGFGFLGIGLPVIPLAFVEPDEKQLPKKSVKAQLAVFAAGPFSNILLAGLIVLFSLFVMNPLASNMIEMDGVLVSGLINTDNNSFPAELAGISPGEVIQEIDGIQILEVKDFTAVLTNHSPGDILSVKTNSSSYDVILASSPEDENKAYFGIFISQNKHVSESFKDKFGSFVPGAVLWFMGLLYWLALLNFGIGLFNLVPLGPIDGGRMLHLVLTKWLGDKRGMFIWKIISFIFLLLIIFIIGYGFVA